MKKIYVAVLLMLSMQSIRMYAAQDSVQDTKDIMTQHMKDIFLNTLDTAIKEDKNLSQLDDPLFLYVMEHKDATLRDMVRLWLLEWSKIQDKDGRTPLHWATRHNNIEIAGMLIDAGADLNIQDNNLSLTPLHLSLMHYDTEIARILIAADAGLNIKDKYGSTPLHWAIMHNHTEIARILIAAGADLNIQNNNGQTVLHTAVRQSVFVPAVEDNRIEIVRMLIAGRADLNIQDNNGETVLHTAVKNNRIEIVRMLITAGADLNIKNNNGRKARQYARTSEDLREIFAQARQKQQEKYYAQAMVRLEKLIKKDWQ